MCVYICISNVYGVLGDGILDIVVTAVSMLDDHSCHIWTFNGKTGELLDGYPISLPHGGKHAGSVSSPILLVDMHDYRFVFVL